MKWVTSDTQHSPTIAVLPDQSERSEQVISLPYTALRSLREKAYLLFVTSERLRVDAGIRLGVPRVDHWSERAAGAFDSPLLRDRPRPHFVEAARSGFGLVKVMPP